MNNLNKLKIKIVILILTIVFSRIFASAVAAFTATETDISVDTDFYVAIDYYAEKLRILNPNSILARYGSLNYMEIYDNGNFISGSSAGIGKSDLAKNISVAQDGEYMYALKAVSDETLDSYSKKGKNQRKITALRKEKWYPIYGGGIDISKIIPARISANSKKQYYIAIRRADDIFDTKTGYASRITILIKPRYNDRDLNKFIEYDAETEKIVLSKNYDGGDSLDIIYRYDYFDNISGTITKNGADLNSNIDVSGELFPLGGVVYISTMPVLKEGAYGYEVAFARSKEIKFKIPKLPALPSINADIENRKLVSAKKDVLEWSLDGTNWGIYGKLYANLPFGDVLSAFAGLDEKNMDENGNYIIYFRTKAVANKIPASLPKKILIPAELC